jgi:hypothetical protein
LALFIGLLVTMPSTAAPDIPLHYEVDVRLDPLHRTLNGQASIRIDDADGLELLLNPAMRIGQATLDGNDSLPGTAGRGEPIRLQIPPGAPGRMVHLQWQGALATAPPGMRHEDTLGHRTPTGDPNGSFLPASGLWYPLPLRSRELTPHSYTLRVATPSGQIGMTAGMPGDTVVQGADTVTEYRFPYPGRGIDLIAGPYRFADRDVATLDGRPLRLRTLFHEELMPLAGDYLDAAESHIARYEALIGPYPYDSFTVVSSPTPTGFGMPTMTYLGIQVLRLPFIRDTSLAHEVLHNWWGNGVFPDYASGNWSEGLTTFMADYDHAERSGEDHALAMRLNWLRELSGIPREADRPLADFTARHHGVSQAVGYNKAAMLFLMLRERIGPDAFHAGLRRFWERHRFDTASWQDLRAAFEQSSGESLEAFFEQWLTRRGLPEIQLERGPGTVLSIRQTGEPWQLDLPLRIVTPTGSEDRMVRIEDRLTSLDLSGRGLPLEVRLDPDNRSMRRLDRFEAPPILRELQFARAAQLAIAAPRAMHADAETLATRLLDDRPRQLSARRAPDPSQPLLVIGVQAEIADWLARHGLPETPREVAGQGDARMWTHRLASGEPLAVIAADTPAALALALRPLPHYRQQSWLILEQGRAQSRGTWPAAVPTITFGHDGG